jgi:Mg2+-importing ATPase
VLLVLAIVFVSKLLFNKGFSNIPELLLFIIALAVGTVPEVLPVIATVSLSNGAFKLAKKHVVVKRLSSIEDLGNVNLLCTDKTGTITENKMVIKNIVSDNNELFQKLAYASIVPIKRRKHRAENSYDDAFINYVSTKIEKEAKNLTVVKEFPFDPEERRRRVVLEDITHKKYYLVVIGAPEVLLKISRSDLEDYYLHHIEDDGKQGLHHISLAYKVIINYDKDFDIPKNEHGLTFLGYVSLYDPLRHTAKSAIHHAEKLGIGVKIITGDSREVAEYVGKEIGLIKGSDKVYLGSELEEMSENNFKQTILKNNIFARVSPTQKYRIIQALKKQKVVAYQGDGINDAPSLKLADVAIAVNTATDIAKDSADIVILNKSLDVIINGIKYGRSIFVNINKYIRYTMSNNFGVLVGSSILYLFSAILPILPVQMLLNNLFGDIPLIMVSLDTVEDDEVLQPKKHNIKDLMFISLVLGVPTALFEILYFVMVKSQPEKLVQTSLYVFFTFQALVIFYAIRNKNHFWQAKSPANILNVAFLLAFIFSLGIIFVPQFQIWFSFVPLSIISIITILVLMAAYFFIADTIKVWYYKKLVSDKID